MAFSSEEEAYSTDTPIQPAVKRVKRSINQEDYQLPGCFGRADEKTKGECGPLNMSDCSEISRILATSIQQYAYYPNKEAFTFVVKKMFAAYPVTKNVDPNNEYNALVSSLFYVSIIL